MIFGSLSGFAVFALSLFAGVLGTFVLGMVVPESRWPGVFFLCAGISWIAMSLWWKRGTKLPPAEGANPTAPPAYAPRRSPSLFFVPMQYLAVLPIGLGLLLLVIGGSMEASSNDPRKQQLAKIEAEMVGKSVSGNQQVALAVYNAIAGKPFDGRVASDAQVHVSDSERGRLVIVRIENQRRFKGNSRDELVKAVKAVAGTKQPLYVGLRGKLLYTYTSTPAGDAETTAGPEDLVPFFGDKPGEAGAVEAQTKPAAALPPASEGATKEVGPAGGPTGAAPTKPAGTP